MARKADLTVTPISNFVREVAATDRAAALAFFLVEQGKSVCGYWRGRMCAADQRALFGMFIGKGMLSINGAREMVEMTISQCFGMDFSTEFAQPWTALDAGVLSSALHLGHIAQPYRYGLAA